VYKEYDLFWQGLCTGLISGVVYTRVDICEPSGVSHGQEVGVVVQYIDARPAYEDFRKLALEALVAAWPCKR
jgi:hypothetical protein